MTTIAWDGREMAGDKRTSYGGLFCTTRKLHRINGCLVGGCGVTTLVAELRAWFEAGAVASAYPASCRDMKECPSLMVVRADGSLAIYDGTPNPVEIEQTQWAIGSGRDFAMAAMHLGNTAREAVEVACALDLNSGNGVDTLTLEVAP